MPALACGKAPRCAMDYQSRISGPLFDRIDLHVDVPAVAPPISRCRRRPKAAPRSARGWRTREAFRMARYKGHGVRTNAEADGELLDQVATPEPDGLKLLTQAVEKFKLSARGYHRCFASHAHSPISKAARR